MSCPKREILHYVVASKFDLRLIQTPRIRRIYVTQVFCALKKQLSCAVDYWYFKLKNAKNLKEN